MVLLETSCRERPLIGIAQVFGGTEIVRHGFLPRRISLGRCQITQGEITIPSSAPPPSSLPLPLPKDLESRLNVRKRLLYTPSRRAVGRAKNELRAALPARGQAPLLIDLLTHVIAAHILLEMLKTAAETFGAQGRPDCEGIPR